MIVSQGSSVVRYYCILCDIGNIEDGNLKEYSLKYVFLKLYNIIYVYIPGLAFKSAIIMARYLSRTSVSTKLFTINFVRIGDVAFG